MRKLKLKQLKVNETSINSKKKGRFERKRRIMNEWTQERRRGEQSKSDLFSSFYGRFIILICLISFNFT